MLKDKIINPLDYFDHNNKSGAIYKTLRERLFKLLPQMGGFPPNKMENRKGIPIISNKT